MSKNIAIFTFVGWFNNGNRLQNYALQHVLEQRFNANVKTILYNYYFINSEKKTNFFHKLVDNKYYYESYKNYKRYKKFKKFDRLVHYDDTLYTQNNISELNRKYDFFVCGSDQIWNAGGTLKSFLFSGIDDRKKLSYAASVGRAEISKEEERTFKRHLDSFEYISVREVQSKDVLQPLTKTPVEAHIDPTFLVEPETWKTLENKPKGLGKKDYIFVCTLGETSKEYSNFINSITKENNLKIVSITDKSSRFYTSSPDEFLYLIDHAKLVLTDSFHAIVFSIIFNRPFIHMERIGREYGDMSVRLKNLEELFNTKFETISNFDKENLFEFKIKNSEEIILKERERAFKYLEKALGERKVYNNLKDKDFNCAGCGLCASICPKGAISYKTNEKGFIKPVIDEEKCVHCGLCANRCSELQVYRKLEFKQGIYALKNKVHASSNSSTIGFVNMLAEKIINEGGVVFGVAYSKTNSKFVKAEAIEDLKKIQGSKYYQADITNIYSEIKELISKNKKVMVCGTPCQIAGLYNRFGDNQNLLLVQVICHGVPPYKLFQRTCKEVYGAVPNNVNFKLHEPAWDNYSVEYTFVDKTQKILRTEEDFMKLYLADIALNDCCYTCNYAGKNTGADFIVGDCWGINWINKKFYDKNGVSIVDPCSSEAKKLLLETKSVYDIYKIPKSKYNSCNPNLFRCPHTLEKENSQLDFFEQIKNKSVKEAYKNIVPPEANQANSKLTFKQKLKRKIKTIIKKIIRY